MEKITITFSLEERHFGAFYDLLNITQENLSDAKETLVLHDEGAKEIYILLSEVYKQNKEKLEIVEKFLSK